MRAPVVPGTCRNTWSPWVHDFVYGKVLRVEGLTMAVRTPEAIDEGIDRTIANWHRWSDAYGWEGPWQEEIQRSALLLKQSIFAPTGTLVAAATTSLPESLTKDKKWDYPYSWFRDPSCEQGSSPAASSASCGSMSTMEMCSTSRPEDCSPGSRILARDQWRSLDSGMWELPKTRHYTTPKLGCWRALVHAAHLADIGQIPGRVDRRRHEADAIREWVGSTAGVRNSVPTSGTREAACLIRRSWCIRRN